MKKIKINFLLWILFSLMQCGPIVGTLEYGGSGGPVETLWLMLPFSFLCLALVIITTGYAVPRLLLRRRWGLYATLEFCMAYLVSLVEQLVIFYIWSRWNIIPPDHRINWGWLAVNTLCNTLMLFFTLLAVGGWYLFDSARSDMRKEKILTGRIESYMEAVRRMLRPEIISKCLGQIADKVETYPQEAERDINALASELRTNLYSLPVPPAIDKDFIPGDDNRKFNRWLTSRSYHAARVIVFQLSLICICFGAFFATPDQPEFSSRIGGFLILLAMFEIMAFIDIYVFFRSFRKNRRRGRFILASGLLAAIIILPILIERVLLYLTNPQDNDALFIFITSLATAATILMIAFYIAGIGAVLLYQDWMLHTRRLISLHASTKRLEYANLKKQINPHFLFNVLNNAGVLTMLDAADARHILLELRNLIDYQFRETERSSTQLSETISFLRAYLVLESTRRDLFSFNISCEGKPDGVAVPSLLFIPFVENAVKYSVNKNGSGSVKVRFEIKGSRLMFECENPIGENHPLSSSPTEGQRSSETGGLGIANTLRRLELLYDDDFYYSAKRGGGFYRVMLNIPVSGNSAVDIPCAV